MYIKQIIIQGFKSYKEQTVIEPFSPKHNVIVGRNGSGKSNFFAAIRFVLGDAYTQMGRGERQALLHEGTGSAVMSAFVEVIFDNSDERFPTGKTEVILRRTIGMKKDEYSLDKKSATKLDVMNLLESAGFSRSNPYYIVPQGRVTALTNMKDSERLSLLKEVAGTQVYESRRTESLKIMTEVENKREKIDDILKYIQERLAELEEEMEELREFQEKDKDRRCLQYTIDHREQEAIANELENLQEQRQTGVDGTDDSQERINQGEKELAAITAEISGLNQQVDFLKVDKKQYEEERRDKARARAKLELEVKSLSEGLSAAQQAMDSYDSELRSLQDSILQHEVELADITPQYELKSQEEGRIKSELDSAEGTRQRLYTKQGRNARFRNKKERDDWLRAEIKNSNSQLAGVKAAQKQTAEDITELEGEIASTEAEIVELRAQLDERGTNDDAMQKGVQEARATRDTLMDERKELWRADSKLDSVLSNARNELRRAEQELSHMMDQNTSRGLASVRRIKRQEKLEGLYGTLAELVKVDERYQRAVESTAGNSLFHYIVDNDVTATRVIEILQKEKSGRITFIPLNRVKHKNGDVPAASDSIPMLEKLEFDPIYERAFQQVFGQTIICPNLTVAGQYARSHGVNGVTLDGDRSDRKGAFTGGFIDSRQSRLQAVRKLNKWRDDYEGLMAQSTEIKRTLERKDQEITRAVGELQKIEQKRMQQENSYGPLRQELRSKSASLQVKKDTLVAEQRAKANIEANLKSLLDQQSAHKAEISSEFKNALTKDEEAQLKNLSSTVQDLRRRYSEVSLNRGELESRKTYLENELRENLRPRLDQLKAQERDDGSQGNLNESQRGLKKIDKEIGAVERKLQECEVAIEKATGSIAEFNQRHAEIIRMQAEINKSLEKQQKRLEKSIQKRRILTKQAAECANKIRDLGILPHGALDKYAKTSSDSIVKRLHKVHEALKKYTHVNKKAIEQYNSFISQRDTLIKRRSDLDSSKSSIQELISVLDQRKDEAIERTFKQVSKEFANVFEKLVPAGRGRLVIQRKSDRQQAADEEDSDDERRQSVENYTGVGISVSFNSKHDDQQRIQQLSGGQKSLCALALVFAIQKCDPAPFYLFDEIDANLDAQYRQAVADMLKSIADTGGEEGGSGGQFICTTFRPEMLHVAEKCYGVRYERKSSAVVVVSKAEALDFVEGERQ